MNRKFSVWYWVSILTLIFLMAAQSPVFAAVSSVDMGKGSARPLLDETMIVVDSGLDLDTSMSKTCISDIPCTLRRAIAQSRNVAVADRPVNITFNIPADAANGYDSVLQVWKLTILTTSDASVFRRIKGQTSIDGVTQPGGRESGPKIFLVGPGTGQKDGLIVGDLTSDNGIIIRGLGFQNFKTHIHINSSNNLIEDNWFGLNADGQSVYMRSELHPLDGSGNAGIVLSSGTQDNPVHSLKNLGK